MIRSKTVSFARSAFLVAILTGAFAPHCLAQSQTTITQNDSSWKLYDSQGNIAFQDSHHSDVHDSATAFNLYNAPTVPLVNKSSITTMLSIDSTAGKIRSFTEVDLDLAGYDGSGNGWGEYSLKSSSFAFSADRIDITDSSPAFIEFAIISDGSFDHSLQTIGEYASANMTAFSHARTLVRYEDPDALPFSNGALGTSSNTVIENLDSLIPGDVVGARVVDGYSLVNFESRPGIVPLVQLDGLSSVGITLYYEEIAEAKFDFLDAEQGKIVITNDFTQTANLGIRFFDENMNVMENVNYTSALGINYQPIVSAVPEPSSLLMLSAMGILGFIPRRRA